MVMQERITGAFRVSIGDSSNRGRKYGLVPFNNQPAIINAIITLKDFNMCIWYVLVTGIK
jgi:hypothetical protein